MDTSDPRQFGPETLWHWDILALRHFCPNAETVWTTLRSLGRDISTLLPKCPATGTEMHDDLLAIINRRWQNKSWNFWLLAHWSTDMSNDVPSWYNSSCGVSNAWLCSRSFTLHHVHHSSQCSHLSSCGFWCEYSANHCTLCHNYTSAG